MNQPQAQTTNQPGITWEQLIMSVSDLTAQGKLSEAVERALLALEMAETFQPDDRRLGLNLELLSELYYMTKQYSLGATTSIRLVELYKRTLGEAHSDTATVMLNAAMLFHSASRYKPAEDYYLKALTVNNDRNDQEQIRNIQIQYTRLLKECGRLQAAEAMNVQDPGGKERKLRRSGQFEAYPAENLNENRLNE
jgi:hypothetical protein